MLSILNTFTIPEDNLMKYLINLIITLIIYVIIHYLLFSGFIQNNFINKFKYLFYALVLGDFIYAKNIYDIKIKEYISNKQDELNYIIYSKQELPKKINHPKIIKPYIENDNKYFDNQLYQYNNIPLSNINNQKFNIQQLSNNNDNNKSLYQPYHIENNNKQSQLEEIVKQTQINKEDFKNINNNNNIENKENNIEEINDNKENNIEDINDNKENKIEEINDNKENIEEINDNKENKIEEINNNKENKIEEINDTKENEIEEINDNKENEIEEIIKLSLD